MARPQDSCRARSLGAAEGKDGFGLKAQADPEGVTAGSCQLTTLLTAKQAFP